MPELDMLGLVRRLLLFNVTQAEEILMNKYCLYAIICLLLHVVPSTSVFAGIYSFDTQTLSGGDTIDAGFITTDGTIGSVDISNIVDYELNWTGDSTVYKFTPLNSTFSGTAIASATNIFVEGIGVNQQVSISSDTLVLTRVEWVSQPGERAVFTIENGSGEASLGFTSAVPIGTAVPEPNALLFLGLVSFGCMSRKKRGHHLSNC